MATKSNKLSRAGGGPRSRVVTHRSVRTGAQRQQIHAGGVAQIGQRQGSHTTGSNDTGYRGERLVGPKHPISVKLGNEVAASTVRGPGGSRTVMRGGVRALMARLIPAILCRRANCFLVGQRSAAKGE
jgi:hypothetical protein